MRVGSAHCLLHLLAVILPAVVPFEQCLTARCTCQGHIPWEPATQCGCRCSALQSPRASAPSSYTHSVCNAFNGKPSCCAHESIEAAISSLGAEWEANPRYSYICRRAWELVLCALLCDPELATTRTLAVTTTSLAVRGIMAGYQSCDSDSDFELDPSVQYRYGPVTWIQFPDNDCKVVEKFCGMSGGTVREYLGAIVGFQLPVLSDPGSTLTVWPQCTSFYEGDLGGVNQSELLALQSEEQCARECSINLFSRIEATTLLPSVQVLCECSAGWSKCPGTAGNITAMVRWIYGVSVAEACALLEPESTCLTTCGVRLAASGPQFIGTPPADVGDACNQAMTNSAACSTLLNRILLGTPPAPVVLDHTDATHSAASGDIVATVSGPSPSSGMDSNRIVMVVIILMISLGTLIIVVVYSKREAIEEIYDNWFPKHEVVHEWVDEEEEEGCPQYPSTTTQHASKSRNDYWTEGAWQSSPPPKYSTRPAPSAPHVPRPQSATTSSSSTEDANHVPQQENFYWSDEEKSQQQQQHSKDVFDRSDTGLESSITAAQVAWHIHQEQWEAFQRNPPKEIKFGDIPWLPILEEEGIQWQIPDVVVELPLDVMKLGLIWHPDKFQQRYGANLIIEDRERIMNKVVAISQTLNNSRDALKTATIVEVSSI